MDEQEGTSNKIAEDTPTNGDAITITEFILEETSAEPDYSVTKAVTGDSIELPLTSQKHDGAESTAVITEEVNTDLYHPAADEGVDDEATMEEEERDGEADDEEIDELGRLGEIPLEDLLRMYGAAPPAIAEEPQPSTSVSQAPEIVVGITLSPATQNVEQTLPSTSQLSVEAPDLSFGHDDEDWTTSSEEGDEGHGTEEYEQKRKQEREELTQFLARLSRGEGSRAEGDSDDESSADDDFIPVSIMQHLKREVPVGSAYQVETPELNQHSAENVADFTDEILQWKPLLPEEDVIVYLKAAYIQERELLKKEIPPDQLEQTDVADDEEFLKELLDCSYDKDEALRRCRRNFRPGRYESSRWSEKECQDFEEAMGANSGSNWKRFTNVAAVVPTRTLKEVIEFYYRWKKSSRFEIFLAKLRFHDSKDYKVNHALEEKVKIRLGRKRPFDAMDATAEDQLSISEVEKVTVEPRQKSARIMSQMNPSTSSSHNDFPSTSIFTEFEVLEQKTTTGGVYGDLNSELAGNTTG